MGMGSVPRVTTVACMVVLFAASSASGQQQIGPRVADARQPQIQQRPQGMPAWFPLEPALKKHTDDVLTFWEFHSAKIERYRSDFQRWEYDRQNFDPRQFQTYSEGKIKYAQPDKGLFEVTALTQVQGLPNGKFAYKKQQATEFEKWICDGTTVFEFDHRNKQLIERGLPPEMRGKQIVEGPLPFLFGAKKAQIESRYWVRINPEKKDVFWLEAVPKRREDTANFRQVDIVIPDTPEYLPKAIILHHRGGTQTTFEFTNRETNWNETFEKLAVWNRAFFNPAIPAGWKRVKQPAQQQQVIRPQGQVPPVRQAQRGVQSRAPR
ncbi:MAG: TIGR03009 domain-containing protein [Planctomycetes bacterium]|nr:TIGR03009 domain-containing protein [Planctomycetota bacterium]